MWKLAPVLLEAAASRNPNIGTNTHNPVVFYDSRRNPYHFPQIHQTPNSAPQVSSQLSSPLTQCVWTFFWLAVLLIIALPIGLFSCQLYVLLSPISALSSCFSVVTNFLLRLAHMPLGCAHNMVQAKPMIFI